MIFIPEQDLHEEFVRPASGNGGQHLNKTSNGVRLHWNFVSSSLLTDVQKQRLRIIATPAVIGDEIVIYEHAGRSLIQNRNNAKMRLYELIEQAVPEPKKRKKTKATRSSIEKRLKKKSVRSQVKKLRRGSFDSSD